MSSSSTSSTTLRRRPTGDCWTTCSRWSCSASPPHQSGRTGSTSARTSAEGTAYELRLWDALAADLLVPFHYFGVPTTSTSAGFEWKRGAYDVVGLDQLYTGNDARAAKVLRELRDKVTDVGTMRALGFCVSSRTREYMARVFREAGIPALPSPARPRRRTARRALDALRRRDVNVLFAADLFNEGLDLPEVDTVLFLRPTQSATIFLQQLGRGLRRAHGKAVLTVLDFIGQQRREFRFDVRYRALTGATRRGTGAADRAGLPVPALWLADCAGPRRPIDRARERPRQLQLSRRELVADVRSHGDLSLADYLREAGRELADIYRRNGSWTALRRDAGLPTAPAGPAEDRAPSAGERTRARRRPRAGRALQARRHPRRAGYDELSDARASARPDAVLHCCGRTTAASRSYADGLAAPAAHPAVCAELHELWATASTRPDTFHGHSVRGCRTFRSQPRALPPRGDPRRPRLGVDGSQCARQHHRRRLGGGDADGRPPHQPAQERARLLADDDVPRLRAQPGALPLGVAERYVGGLAHWPSLPRAVEMGTQVVLFARETPDDDIGAAPFLCLGQATYVEHRGDRPIAITWRLRRPMPAETFKVASVVA